MTRFHSPAAGISECRSHPAADDEDRQALVNGWRAARVKQLLTPAPDGASVKWKQDALARRKYEYTGLKPERLKHAIAEDLAFLAAHPVRQSNRRSAKANTSRPTDDEWTHPAARARRPAWLRRLSRRSYRPRGGGRDHHTAAARRRLRDRVGRETRPAAPSAPRTRTRAGDLPRVVEGPPVQSCLPYFGGCKPP